MSKETTYITDVQDTFDKPRAAKEALKLSEEIKQAQQQAHPSKDFKESLLTRLENIYSLEQADEAPSRFSIFQIFGAVFSFCFIIGTSFMVFDMREDTVLSQPVNISDSSRVMGSKTDESMQPLSLEKGENLERAETREDEKTDDNTQPLFLDDEKNGENTETRDEKMMLQSSQMFRGALQGNPDELSDEEKFQETCDIYGGTLSDDKKECIFKNGIHCDYESTLADSEHPCEAIYWTGGVQTKEYEIDLQELIEEYGQ